MKKAKRQTLTDQCIKPSQEEIETERQLLYLMLNHEDVINEFMEDGIKPDRFLPGHDVIAKAIFDTYRDGGRGHRLSLEGFQSWMKSKSKLRSAQQMTGAMAFAEIEFVAVSKSKKFSGRADLELAQGSM